jgi:hypothetical protein
LQDGKTALDYALAYEHVKIAAILRTIMYSYTMDQMKEVKPAGRCGGAKGLSGGRYTVIDAETAAKEAAEKASAAAKEAAEKARADKAADKARVYI